MPTLVEAIQQNRREHPMRSDAKVVAAAPREGLATSERNCGCVSARWESVQPVPIQYRKYPAEIIENWATESDDAISKILKSSFCFPYVNRWDMLMQRCHSIARQQKLRIDTDNCVSKATQSIRCLGNADVEARYARRPSGRVWPKACFRTAPQFTANATQYSGAGPIAHKSTVPVLGTVIQ